MVSFHGGGFTSGTGNSAGYDGDPLARFGDVVVVTVNHRLGVLGYLYLGDLAGPEYAKSGNAGMLDLVASLEWVRDNIAAFGGDPEERDDLGPVGRRRQDLDAARDAGGEGPLPSRRGAERLVAHDADARGGDRHRQEAAGEARARREARRRAAQRPVRGSDQGADRARRRRTASGGFAPVVDGDVAAASSVRPRRAGDLEGHPDDRRLHARRRGAAAHQLRSRRGGVEGRGRARRAGPRRRGPRRVPQGLSRRSALPDPGARPDRRALRPRRAAPSRAQGGARWRAGLALPVDLALARDGRQVRRRARHRRRARVPQLRWRHHRRRHAPKAS